MLVTKAKVQYVFDCFCTVPIETDHRICVGWIWVVQGVMPQKPLGQQEHGATDPRGYSNDIGQWTINKVVWVVRKLGIRQIPILIF